MPLILNRGVTTVIMFAAVGVLALVAARRGTERASPRRCRRTVAAADRRRERMPRPASVRHGRRRRRARPPPRACGSRSRAAWSTSTANALLLIGIRAGDLSVAAVLGAMYPAGTILLAALVLKERIAPVQWAGLVLALVAAGMLAARVSGAGRDGPGAMTPRAARPR